MNQIEDIGRTIAARNPGLFGGYLGGEARARNTDPDTSHAAAEAISPSLRAIQREVLDYAKARGFAGFTDPAMAEHFGSTSSTLRSRRCELVAMGLIARTDAKVKVGKGRSHYVWRITPAGMAA
jgi:hypothetical protein